MIFLKKSVLEQRSTPAKSRGQSSRSGATPQKSSMKSQKLTPTKMIIPIKMRTIIMRTTMKTLLRTLLRTPLFLQILRNEDNDD